MTDELKRCMNCGADLSVVRISACCNHPGREIDFPFPELPEPMAAMQARITDLEARLAAAEAREDALVKDMRKVLDQDDDHWASIKAALAAYDARRKG